MEGVDRETSQVEPIERKKSRLLLWTAILAFLFLAVAGAGLFLKARVEELTQEQKQQQVETKLVFPQDSRIYRISSSVQQVDREGEKLFLLFTSPQGFPLHGQRAWVKVTCRPEETILRLVERGDTESFFKGGEPGKKLFETIKAGDVLRGDCLGSQCQEINKNCVILREKAGQ